jgi:murein DD-endopeptidase MepM/ murein hydrolase activator NlpD
LKQHKVNQKEPKALRFFSSRPVNKIKAFESIEGFFDALCGMVFSNLNSSRLLTFLFCLSATFAQGQKWTCSSPLDIPLELAGSFAEIRSNHFHSGMDLRTEQREGLPIYCAADGYVSRIKISPFGYGKAIYVTHPEGYVTVYAHLQKFNQEIDSLLRLQHKLKESYEIDWYLKEGQIPLKRGQHIAWSGNSGGSGGPHLHFEVRDSRTEQCLDPIRFGLPVQDTLAPIFESFSAWSGYGASEISPSELPSIGHFVTGRGASDTLPLEIETGKLEVAVSIVDRYLTGGGDCGVKNLRVFVDGSLFYRMEIRSVNFNTTKAINGFVPLGIYKSKSGQWYRCSVPKQTPLREEVSVYALPVEISDSLIHSIRFETEDWKGNVATAVGFIQAVLPNAPKHANAISVHAGVEKVIQTRSGKITFQKESLFDDTELLLLQPVFDSLMPPVVEVGHEGIGLFSPVKIQFNLNEMTPEQRKKVVILHVNSSKRKSIGGTIEGNAIVASSSTLGKFTFASDWDKPVVEFIEQTLPESDLVGNVKFRVSDAFSGIERIRPELGGKWIYYEYDAKNNSVIVELPITGVNEPPQEFSLVVKDKCGNETVYKKTFN